MTRDTIDIWIFFKKKNQIILIKYQIFSLIHKYMAVSKAGCIARTSKKADSKKPNRKQWVVSLSSQWTSFNKQAYIKIKLTKLWIFCRLKLKYLLIAWVCIYNYYRPVQQSKSGIRIDWCVNVHCWHTTG